MARLTKLDQMTSEEKAAEAIKYWAAPNDATFTLKFWLLCIKNHYLVSAKTLCRWWYSIQQRRTHYPL
jgi:hypothetical protein